MNSSSIKPRQQLKHEHQLLVASFLAGEDVHVQLLEACRASPDLLRSLSESIVLERLLKAMSKKAEHGYLIAEIQQSIEHRRGTSIARAVISKLKKEKAQKDSKRHWLFSKAILYSAASICLACIATVILRGSSDESPAAVISKVAGAVAGNTKVKIGQKVYLGSFELDKGFAELDLDNGVSLVMEAPVAIEILSVDRIHLKRGKLVSRVPLNAIGFTVDTPSSKVVDLGTEFGIEVSKNGLSKIHVLDGEIKARGIDATRYKYLKKHEAISFAHKHNFEKILFDTQSFMRRLPDINAELPEYIHWDFDVSGSDGFPPKTSITLRDKVYSNLARYIYREVELDNGQYGRAIYLGGIGKELKSQLPRFSETAARTFSFWVKIPSVRPAANNLLTWEVGKEHSLWSIKLNGDDSDGLPGRLRLELGDNKDFIVGTTNLQDNRWHHVTIVLYGINSRDSYTQMLMYVDGEPERSLKKSMAGIPSLLDSINVIQSLVIGSDDNQSGWLDELYVFDQALSYDQINGIMQNNSLDKHADNLAHYPLIVKR